MLVYLITQQIQNYYLTEIEEGENAGRMNRISESRDDLNPTPSGYTTGNKELILLQ
jgi:hypothetical protein